jgi:hypothetical protein
MIPNSFTLAILLAKMKKDSRLAWRCPIAFGPEYNADEVREFLGWCKDLKVISWSL